MISLFIFAQDDDDDDWFPLDIHEAFVELRKRNVFDVSDMYTITDAWGWTWEKEIKNKAPRRWSQEWEVELGIKVMTKVCYDIPFNLLTIFNTIFGMLHAVFPQSTSNLLLNSICLIYVSICRTDFGESVRQCILLEKYS